MIHHNNEISDLHESCTYMYGDIKCKITDLSHYPMVEIDDLRGNAKTVDACEILHIELTDEYLDKISDRTSVSATTPKTWYFDDVIPLRISRSGKGWYLLSTPFSDASNESPLPITTVDELEHIRKSHRSNLDLIHLYKRTQLTSKQ